MTWARRLAIAFVFSLAPTAAAVGVSAGTATTTMTKQVGRQPFPDAMCQRLTQRTGCYVIETFSQEVTATSPIAQLVQPVDAGGCWGPATVTQTVYSSVGSKIASGSMRFTVCWNGSSLELPFLQCWGSGTVLYGAGVNYCYSPAHPSVWQTEPTWTEENWYFYPYPMPWWKIYNIQEWGVYVLGATPWYTCTYC